MSGLFGWLRVWGARLVAGAALAVVAGVTGVISYTHIYRLTLALHQPVMVARLMPFGVDGLVIVGAVVLLQAPPDHPRLGWLGVVPGVAASLFANVESGIRHGWLAAAWAGVPAVAFALASFMLERWLKGQASRGPAVAVPMTEPQSADENAAGSTPGGGTGDEPDSEPETAPDAVSAPVPTDAEHAALIAMRATVAAGNPLSGRQLETRFGLTRSQATKVRRLAVGEDGDAAADDAAKELPGVPRGQAPQLLKTRDASEHQADDAGTLIPV